MVIDTSALIAILNNEPERSHFTELIALTPARHISTATYIETGIVISARYGPAGLHKYRSLVAIAEIKMVAVDLEQAEIAIEAYRTFGKGSHRAGLNYGDCFSYALAISRDEPLLFKGDDFIYTDVVSALHM